MYDLCETRTGVPSFRKMWFTRSEMYGILRCDHSMLGGRESLMALGALCLLFTALWISVVTKDVVKYVLVLFGSHLCGASIFDTFLLIAKEGDL